MRHPVLPAAVAGLALCAGACAAGPGPTAAPTVAPAAPDACAPFDLHPLRIWIDAPAVRPGDAVPIRAGSVLNQHAGVPPPPPEPVPTACLADLRVTPAEFARVSAGGDGLIVSPDAPVGTLLTVEGESTVGPVRAGVRVVSREAALLIGTWSQSRVDCGPAPAPVDPVRELGFAADGGFSLTWTPFETYTDYWGRYVHDAATGALRLEIEGANRPSPAPVLTGVLRVSEDGRRLTLTGADLGDGRPPVPERRCRYEFGKITPAAAAPP